jgi:hypothetical protein
LRVVEIKITIAITIAITITVTFTIRERYRTIGWKNHKQGKKSIRRKKDNNETEVTNKTNVSFFSICLARVWAPALSKRWWW